MEEMHLEGTVIRPPSEAHSILLQVTLGCTHNKCTFCGAYKDKRFALKPDKIIQQDIDFAARYCNRQRRMFLCDGDVASLPNKRLVPLLGAIKQKLPWVTRVGAYANAKGLKRKSVEELRELRALGLRVLYMGLESGDDQTLATVKKSEPAASIVEQGRKIREAGIKLNVTVLLGLAGTERSHEHAVATGAALTAMQPEYTGALSLMLIPGTPLYEDEQAGKFVLPGSVEMLQELRTMLQHTDIHQGQFFANHASNYLPIQARLPKDKEKILTHIDHALQGRIDLKPEWMRGL